MQKTLTVLAPPSEPIIITRRWFAAPRELVWECWTRAELLRLWMGPRAIECTLYEVDLRVGGGYRFVHRAPDGQEYAFHGEYRAIERPNRLCSSFVFEMFPDQVVEETLTLEPQDGGTLATTRSVFPSLESRDGHLQGGMEHGMREGYERMDELLDAWPQRPLEAAA